MIGAREGCVMRKAVTRAFVGAALASGLCGAATAVPLFELSGGVNVAASNNAFAVIGTSLIREGAAGNPVSLLATAAGTVLIEFIGKEASFPDIEFRWGGLTRDTSNLIATTGPGVPQTVGDTSGNPPAPVPGFVPTTADVSVGPLPFMFFVPKSSTTVENGHAQTGGSDIAYSFGKDNQGASTASIVYLLLDDGGGAAGGPDNDHDDMIIRLTISEPSGPGGIGDEDPIPEPGTLGLLALGLAALGGGTRMKRRLARRG